MTEKRLSPSVAESAPRDASRSSTAGMAGLEPSAVACLRAARPRGLIRQRASRLYIPGSEIPDTGWYATASWSHHSGDSSKGGPWSIERVADLAERGLIGIRFDEARATLTKYGRAALKAALTTPPPLDPQVEGDKSREAHDPNAPGMDPNPQ